MKTTWLYDGQNWLVNPKLLELASCLGFTPKRCQVRRPQTKGKVEWFIQTLGNNFLPWARAEGLSSLDELDEKVNLWLGDLGQMVLRDFLETRDDRFGTESQHLHPFLPEAVPDLREVVPVTVSREGRVTFESNRYSVPAQYLGASLTLKVDRLSATGELFEGSRSVRTFALAAKGSRVIDDRLQDRKELLTLWHRQNRPVARTSPPKAVDLPSVTARNPSYYDQMVAGGDR